MFEMPKVQEVPKESFILAWGLPFIGSDLFILTSMVMSSIIMEVIHMDVSIVIETVLITHWTLYSNCINFQ